MNITNSCFGIGKKLTVAALSATAVLSTTVAWADEQESENHQCLMEAMSKAADDTTVAELKAQCQPKEDVLIVNLDDTEATVEPVNSPIFHRINYEIENADNPFAITPHYRNYILPVTYVNNPQNVRLTEGENRELDNTEIKFQVSLKVPIWSDPLGDRSNLFFAYSGKSLWQAYNSDLSSPFRETNHAPEMFLGFGTDWELWGWRIPVVTTGIIHESNGRSRELSRSWNRIYADFYAEKGDWVLSFKPWWRIPEDEKDDPLDSDGDDNPDIERFLGHFELRVGYKHNKHRFGLMVRNNLRSDNKGAGQFDWSYPLDDDEKVRLYVQYFNGYGESLIDYNRSVSRLGVGFILTDWM